MTQRRLLVVLLLLSAALFPRAASAHQLCFADKTPHCFNDPFSDYWENNGGLPVFGYPITTATTETNADTGQSYNTQWAERNRFEVHPENAGTPYEILLGLLGKDRLRQLGRDPGAEPREAGAKDGCIWFDQTGHNVCNQGGGLGFRQYWENHGLKIAGLDKYSRSLQLFGLPLTEPKMETNASGDTVLTQWFERARFEWHPNEADNFKVLLGLLGSEIRGPGAPPPPPPPPPPPAGVTVVSSTTYVTSSARWIVGEIVNNTGNNRQYVKIIASLYDASNTLIATESSYTEHDIVKPGQKSPFDMVILNPPATFDHYTLQVDSRTTTQQPLEGFSLISSGDRDGGFGDSRYIFGEIRNDSGGSAKYVKQIITLYNDAGTVVQVDYGYTELDQLEAGQMSPFETIVLDWNGATRYVIQIQGRRP